MATSQSERSGTAATVPETHVEQPVQQIEDQQAYEYWGYLFKSDKTGTDKLKSLLKGLKDLMNTTNGPSDNPDLTPNQLAHFYRDLHGNYDQLFLGTPSESIGFIYKSLGCLHSLQPLSHSTAFTEPTVPALKTEGWIMWQTIQLLLGPEEHSSFLIEAVQKWEVKDPVTGEVFPSVLPRSCFPLEPDKHMVAWYEGVSERLRKEADDEERQREIEAQQAEVRRIRDRVRRDDTDDEGSVDSRGPALAYFRNPLYRHVDGRPSIVRRSSKRPSLSPRPTMMDKGKEAANTVGHVIRNIGSPHLWDGRPVRQSESRDRSHRRRSLPDNRVASGGEPATPGAYDNSLSPDMHPGQHHRRRSAQYDRPSVTSPLNDGLPEDHTRPLRDDYDSNLRHSRSHEPTPSQKEYTDYFQGYDDPTIRRNSSQAETPISSNGMGPGFGPSASPLFASHIAKRPQPPPFPRPPPPPTSDPAYAGGPLRKAPSIRHAQDRPYSRSPEPSRHHRDHSNSGGDPRRYSSHDRRSRERHSRFDHSPASNYDDRAPPPGGRTASAGPHPQHHHPQGFPPVGSPLPDRHRSGRISSSDVSAYSGAEDPDAQRSRPKQTRFAAGVDGRRYPNESAWR